jgi:hypothetical protein
MTPAERDALVEPVAHKRPQSAVLKYVRKNNLHVRPIRGARLPGGQLACQRIRELAWDIGRDMKHEHGWKAYAGRKMGLSKSRVYAIVNEKVDTLGTKTVDQVATATGCPRGVF